jgi:hypothetical protein
MLARLLLALSARIHRAPKHSSRCPLGTRPTPCAASRAHGGERFDGKIQTAARNIRCLRKLRYGEIPTSVASAIHRLSERHSPKLISVVGEIIGRGEPMNAFKMRGDFGKTSDGPQRSVPSSGARRVPGNVVAKSCLPCDSPLPFPLPTCSVPFGPCLIPSRGAEPLDGTSRRVLPQ